MTLTVEEARDQRVCRICEEPEGKANFIYNFGKEHAHTECLKCIVCDNELDAASWSVIDGHYIHERCFSVLTPCSVCSMPISLRSTNWTYDGTLKHKECIITGALRSKDADGEDYWLITPIGLRRLAKAYVTTTATADGSKGEIPWLIDIFFDNVYNYLSGNRNIDFLALAATAICELICAETNKFHKDRNYTKDYDAYNQIPPEALKQLAQAYNEGKNKYPLYNCEKGFPIHNLLNHAIRHVNMWRADDRSEPHLSHALWNVLMATHSEGLWPELNKDLRTSGCKAPI